MSSSKKPVALLAMDVPPRAKPSVYPEPFASQVRNRVKRQLGDVFGLSNFGVNLTHVPPGTISALRHSHQKQDEFVYVLEGELVLITDAGETLLHPGMCAGFKAGEGDGHHLVNRTDKVAVYLEVGDRTPGDQVWYPDDDLQAVSRDGVWHFLHKNGEPYS